MGEVDIRSVEGGKGSTNNRNCTPRGQYQNWLNQRVTMPSKNPVVVDLITQKDHLSDSA